MNGFLEYVPGDSLLHRLNPMAKLLFAVLFAIACFCTGNLVYLCCMLAFALAMAASCEEKAGGANGQVIPLKKEDMEKIYRMAL